jgi:hypothetical protein
VGRLFLLSALASEVFGDARYSVTNAHGIVPIAETTEGDHNHRDYRNLLYNQVHPERLRPLATLAGRFLDLTPLNLGDGPFAQGQLNFTK